MTIESIYSPSLEPLFPNQTDEYLQRLPRVNAPKKEEISKTDEKSAKTALKTTADAIRQIEVLRRLVAFQATNLAVLVEQQPEIVEGFGTEVQTAVFDLASRVEQPGIVTT